MSMEDLVASRSQLLYEFGEVEYYRLKLANDLNRVESRAQSLVNDVQVIDRRITELNQEDTKPELHPNHSDVIE